MWRSRLATAAAGAIIYALFCTARQISTGPSSSLAAVAGGAVLAAGVLFLLLAFFRPKWVARFPSRAVITGFRAAAAVDVLAVLRAGGVVELIGAERIHGNVHRAVFAHLAHTQ
jgi:MFS superfamily sulfate permease-like transporter